MAPLEHAIRSRRRTTTGVVALLTGVATALSACAPDLPPSVLPDTTVTVGWTAEVTNLNSGVTGATEGDREIASVTHDGFARLVDGDLRTDPTFGTVEVLDGGDGGEGAEAEPEAGRAAAPFTVRYDLAEREWSDGIPIDAADLLLAWAAGSGATQGEFDSPVTSDLRLSTETPAVDQDQRSIDVAFDTPVRDWQTDLVVSVPAHVVGQLALDIEDPMEAKQAVVDAILDDSGAMADIATVWNEGYALDETADSVPEQLRVASGPYQVTDVQRDEAGPDRVVLEANRRYAGDTPTTIERIEVVATESPLEEFPDELDVVQVDPVPSNFTTVRDLERRDQNVAPSEDGRMWVLALRGDRGAFTNPAARRAFLRAVPRTDVANAGAGVWEQDYSSTTSFVFQPGVPGFDISTEDAGFRTAFEDGSTEPAADRAAAGIPDGTQVCVLHDNDDPFARAAYESMPALVADSGWQVTDCGRKRIDRALRTGRRWQAVITTVTLPVLPADVTATWGGAQPSPLTGLASPARAELVEQIATTPDPYDARDLMVEVDAGLVQDSVGMPLSLVPTLTLSRRGLDQVTPGSGPTATLLQGATAWTPEQ